MRIRLELVVVCLLAVGRVISAQAPAADDFVKSHYAKLCRKNGGDLEQITFLLGHSSIQTTERYLGSEQGNHRGRV